MEHNLWLQERAGSSSASWAGRRTEDEQRLLWWRVCDTLRVGSLCPAGQRSAHRSLGYPTVPVWLNQTTGTWRCEPAGDQMCIYTATVVIQKEKAIWMPYCILNNAVFLNMFCTTVPGDAMWSGYDVIWYEFKLRFHIKKRKNYKKNVATNITNASLCHVWTQQHMA